jgi:hypothetical protein
MDGDDRQVLPSRGLSRKGRAMATTRKKDGNLDFHGDLTFFLLPILR